MELPHLDRPVHVINVLGDARLAGPGIDTARPRHICLLSILLYYHPTAVSRERVQEIIWDGSSSERKRQSLNQLLYELRRTAEGLITSSGSHLALGPVQSDLIEFRASLAAADYNEAVHQYRGGFLANYTPHSRNFDDWRASVALTLAADAIGAYRAGINAHLLADEYPPAAELAQRALMLEPDDANLLLLRVECLARAGDTQRALLELESGRRRFAQDGNPLPEDTISELLDRLTRYASSGRVTTDAGHARLRLVGRGHEIRVLRQHWQDTARIASALAIIAGEAGIGKTRVLEHIGRIAAIDGARVFTMRCLEPESRLPYAAITGLLRDGWRTADKRLLGPERCKILSKILPEAGDAVELGDIPQIVIWDSVVCYLREISRSGRRLFLCIDDYHWADAASRDLLTFALRRSGAEGCFLALAGRGAIAAPLLEDDSTQLIYVHLKELDEASAGAALDQLEDLHQRKLTSGQRNSLIARSGGRPFFLVQSAQHILSDSGDPVGVPPDVSEYMSRRLLHLTAAARQIVGAAATLGRPAPLHVLAAVTGLSPAETAVAAAELTGEGILTDNSEVGFAHDLIHEAVLAKIPPAEQTLWHAEIFKALQSASRSDPGEVSVHAELAGDLHSAALHAMRAAARATGLHAYGLADEHFVRAIRCSAGEGRKSALASYVEFLAHLGRYEDISNFIGELEEHFDATGNAFGIVIASMARFYRAEGDGRHSQAELVALASHCVSQASELCPQYIGHVVWQIVECLRRSGQMERLGHFSDQLIAMQSLAVPHAIHELLTASALLAGFARGYSAGIPIAERAVNAARSRGDRVGLARACLVSGANFLLAGEVTRAEENFLEGINSSDVFTPEHVRVSLRSNMGVVLMERGKLEDAVAVCSEVVAEADPSRRAYSYGNLALIHYKRGDWREVDKYCNALDELHRLIPHHWIPASMEAMRGLCELEHGDLASAHKRIEHLNRSSMETTLGHDLTLPTLLHARVLGAQGLYRHAAEVCANSVNLLDRRDELAADRLRLEQSRWEVRGGVPEARTRIEDVASRAWERGATALYQEASSLVDATQSP